MSSSHAKQSKLGRTKPSANVSSPPSTAFDSEIRSRAYQIYESNGRQDHFAEQDWLRAEREVLAERSQ
jgi:hypothetical protein